MKKTGYLFLIIIGIFVLILTFSGSVAAELRLHVSGLHIGIGGRGNQNHYGHTGRNIQHYPEHRNHHYLKHNVYGYYDSHNGRHRNKHKYRSHAYYRNHKRFSSNQRRYNQSYSNYRKPCHQVSKIYYDDDGTPHNTTGTMCYDRYGDGYIVSGSRYTLD